MSAGSVRERDREVAPRWRRRPAGLLAAAAVLAAAAALLLLRPTSSSGPGAIGGGSPSPASDCQAAQSSFQVNWDRSQQLDEQWRRLQAEYGPGAAESEQANTEFVQARVSAARVVVARPYCFGQQAVQDARAFLAAQGGAAAR